MSAVWREYLETTEDNIGSLFGMANVVATQKRQFRPEVERPAPVRYRDLYPTDEAVVPHSCAFEDTGK